MASSRRWRARRRERGAGSDDSGNSLARSLAPRPARSQAGLLHGERCRRRPARGRPARHSVLRAESAEQEFGQIIDYFVAEYTAGRTPNPCVQCNNWIKFGKLFDYADSVGAEFVATGHYARLGQSDDGSTALLRGVDAAKDQSYVLFGIRRELLPRMLLPVGGFEKPEIRAIAAEIGLRVAEKKDSQEICFVTTAGTTSSCAAADAAIAAARS